MGRPGELKNFEIISDCQLGTDTCQVGGGIRDMESIGKLFKCGVDRVILGTSAVEDPQMVKRPVAALISLLLSVSMPGTGKWQPGVGNWIPGASLWNLPAL